MTPYVDCLIVKLEETPCDFSIGIVVEAVPRLHILVVLVPHRDVRQLALAAWAGSARDDQFWG